MLWVECAPTCGFFFSRAQFGCSFFSLSKKAIITFSSRSANYFLTLYLSLLVLFMPILMETGKRARARKERKSVSARKIDNDNNSYSSEGY